MTTNARSTTRSRTGGRGNGGRSRTRPGPKRIESMDTHADHNGQSLVTRNHDVIMRWAEERGAQPATVARKSENARPRVLRFDFPGYGGQALEHIGWDEWFQTFDEREVDFIYQENLKSGQQSNFFRLANSDN
jgi:hypothetical protein